MASETVEEKIREHETARIKKIQASFDGFNIPYGERQWSPDVLYTAFEDFSTLWELRHPEKTVRTPQVFCHEYGGRHSLWPRVPLAGMVWLHMFIEEPVLHNFMPTGMPRRSGMFLWFVNHHKERVEAVGGFTNAR